MLKFLCSLILKVSGWSFKNELSSDVRSFIFIGAPHTSNYDFIPAMSFAYMLKRNTKFVIKNEWMIFPLNHILKSAGAIGLDRSKLKGGGVSTTDIMADLFSKYPEMVLMISPEGTRSPNPNWKTGFYYIAQKANVPIVLGYADFEKKIVGIGPMIYPSDFEKDMREIMAFYQQFKGNRPENFKLDSRYM